jgi:hypothetical protein
MKARNYSDHINILMTVINRLCDFCHTGAETSCQLSDGNKINQVSCGSLYNSGKINITNGYH